MKRLTININGRFLTQPITGVQRFAVETVKALDDLLNRGEIDCGKYAFRLLVPSKGLLHELDLQRISVNRAGYLSGHIWEQLELPFYSTGSLLVSFCNAAPFLKRNQVVTIHDASVFGFPHAYSLVFRIWYRFLLKALGATARRIITVSTFSRDELVRYCGLNARKVRVVSEGKEHILAMKPAEDILRKHGLHGRRFVLGVSSMNPNKNFHTLVRAIELLKGEDCIAVFAGGTNPRIFGRTETSLPANVMHVGYVSDPELRTLYEHAACFVYPSFYEGFGLPPLEAMACGCPVVVSDTASLPEVCGDAALYCDPRKPEDIAEKIQTLLHDGNLRSTLREKGIERSRQFSWDGCARGIFSVIEELNL